MRNILSAALLLWAASFSSAQADGIVTFTFDDGSISQFENGLPIAKEHGLRGTLFVATGGPNAAEKPDDGQWSMKWSHVLQFVEAGWEIGSHTQSHPKLPGLSDEQVELELARAFVDIVRNTGIIPYSFASPHGEFDDRVVEIIKDYHANHFAAWGGNEGRNPIGGVDYYHLGRRDVTYNDTAAGVCGEIESAGSDNIWLVLIFHRIVEGTPNEYEVSTDTFEAITRCAIALQEEGRIKILPAKEAFSLVPNLG